MQRRYFLSKIEPQSTAARPAVPGRVAAKERLEKVRQQLRGNMHALVLHRQNNMAIFPTGGNTNFGTLRRVESGVGKEIANRFFQEGRVPSAPELRW